jgi:hypothetical protein
MEFEKEQVWQRLANSGEYKTYYFEANDDERAEFRRWVKSLLQDGPVTVEFEKVNGETRVMTCTLSEQHGAKYANKTVSESVATADAKPRKKNDDACAVWDTTAEAWRSFRWDRVRKLDFKI